MSAPQGQDERESSASASSTLIELARRNDPQAWRRLVDQFGPAVFYWCHKQGVKPQDIDDIFQDVFLAVSNNLDRYPTSPAGGGFRAWMWTITLNKFRDQIRRRRRKQLEAQGGSDGDELVQMNAVFERLSDADTPPPDWPGEVVRKAAELLRDRVDATAWTAFWQTTIEGRNSTDVVRDLGITANAVRKAKSRMLARLRQELGELA